MTKDSERIYHIERKVDEILEILKQIGYIAPSRRNPLTDELWPIGDPPNGKPPMYVNDGTTGGSYIQ